MPGVDRRRCGDRDFSDTHLRKLAFARGLGFLIEDCRDLLAFWKDQDRVSRDMRPDCPIFERLHLGLDAVPSKTT